MGTDPLKVPIRKEFPALWTVCLLNHLRIDVSTINKAIHHVTGTGMGGRVISHPEMVKDNIHAPECLGKMCMIAF